MNILQAGFARVNVTPMMGIGITGYYKPRFVKGVRDELELSALALTCGQTRLVLLSMDHCGIHTPEADPIRAYVAEKTGLPVEAVYLHATHTHTGPCLVRDSADPLEREYYELVLRRAADAARYALADCKPARMGYGVGSAPNIAFISAVRTPSSAAASSPTPTASSAVRPTASATPARSRQSSSPPPTSTRRPTSTS